MLKPVFTQAGYDDLLKEKNQLEETRKSAVSELSVARDMGDRSENAFYKTARQKLSGIDRRLREINRILRKAEVVKPRQADRVEVGHTVTVSVGGERKEYLVVGAYESDLSKGRLSFMSPVGRALLGRQVGETVSIALPSGEAQYTIEKIS